MEANSKTWYILLVGGNVRGRRAASRLHAPPNAACPPHRRLRRHACPPRPPPPAAAPLPRREERYGAVARISCRLIHHHVARCHRPVVIHYVRALHRRLRRRVHLWAAQPSASMPPTAAAAGIFPTVGEEYSGLRSASGGVEEAFVFAIKRDHFACLAEEPKTWAKAQVSLPLVQSQATQARARKP